VGVPEIRAPTIKIKCLKLMLGEESEWQIILMDVLRTKAPDKGKVSYSAGVKAVGRGKFYTISREKLQENLRGIEPEEGKVKYFVEIEGTKFPIKQVLSRTLDLSKATFTTQHAFDILTRLGFKITGAS